MELKTYNGAFSNHFSGITLIVTTTAKLEEDFSRRELPGLIYNLLDVADDCLVRLEDNEHYAPIRESVRDALNAVYDAMQKVSL